jgi:serralysin
MINSSNISSLEIHANDMDVSVDVSDATTSVTDTCPNSAQLSRLFNLTEYPSLDAADVLPSTKDSTADTPRCGCAICSSGLGVKGANVNALSADSGTASEATLSDSSPTDGTNPFIDSLVWGGRWVSSGDPDETVNPTVISYYLASGTDPFEVLPDASYKWDSTATTAITAAFKAWENVANIDFQQVTDGEDADAWIWLGTGENAYGALGWSDVPASSFSSGEPLFTVFNKEDPTWSKPSSAIGGYGFITAIHEFGHLLGLAHPHDGGDDGDVFQGVTSDFGDFGYYEINQGIYTTMSYNDGWKSFYGSHSALTYGYQATPMALDIGAIQLIYVANTSYKSGNDTYLLPKQNAAGTYWSCIWDTGGTDTISNAGSSLGCTIVLWYAGELVGGIWGMLNSYGGHISWATGIVGGYTIAENVWIENAIGGSGDDLIGGNQLNNSLVGGDGNDLLWGFGGADTIDGGNGFDRIQFLDRFADYSVAWSGNNLVFTHADGDKSIIRNCENFEFGDQQKTLAEVAPAKDSTPPLLQSSEINVDGTKIVLTYNETLGAAGPAAAAFSIKIAGKSVLASSVVVSGSTLELAIPQTVRSSQVVQIAYKAAKPDVSAANPSIQDAAGNDAVSFATAVTNNSTVDGTAPQLQSVATNSDRNKIILTYNETLGAIGPIAKAFAIKVAGKSVTGFAVVVSGSTIELSLPSATSSSAAISIGYKAPKADGSATNAAIQDSAGNDAISFTRTFNASAKLAAANHPTNTADWLNSFQVPDAGGAGLATQSASADAFKKTELIGIAGLMLGEPTNLAMVSN